MLGRVTSARKDLDVNQLKAARERRNWSQSRAIAAIQSNARSLGCEVPAAASLKTQLSRWENGHRTPDVFYRRLLGQTYGQTAEQLGIGRGDANNTKCGLDVARTWQDAAVNASHLWEEDMNRRSFLKSVGFAASAFAGPSFGALVWSRTEHPSRATGARSVDDHDVHAIQEMTSGFGSIDNKHGGGQIRTAAVGFLTNEVAPPLHQGRFNARIGHSLFVAAAELTQLVGWMSHDVGAHGLGQRYLIQALSLAKAANDEALMGEILAAMSHQATYLGDGAQAIDLARAAGQIGQRRGVAALVAESHVMEAHGHATLGQHVNCAKSLHSAEAALDRADRSSDPHWIGYFDEAYLAARFGHCFRILGDSTNAVRFAERSLIMNSDRYARGHAFNLTLLAHSHAQCGNVEQACQIGQKAVAATAGLRSERAVTYLRDFRRDLPGNAAAVQILDETLAGLTAA